MSNSTLPPASSSRVRRSSTGTTAKHRSRGSAHATQDLVFTSSPPAPVPVITRSDGLARNPPLSHRRSSQGSDSSDSYRPRTPHSESPPGPRDFRHRADTGASSHTSGHSLNSHSGSPTGTLSTIPEGGTAGSSGGGNGAIGGGSGRRKSRRSSRSSSARHQRHSRPGSISPLSTSPREQSLPARKSSGNSSAILVSKEYGTTSSSKQHPSSSSGDARLMSSDSASPVRVRLSGFDSTQEASSHTTPASDASIYSGMMSTSSELSKEMLKLQQLTILHSESERTSSGGAAAATSSLTTIGEDGVLESTVPPLPSLGRESVDSSSESSLNKRMFSPRYSSAASSPATTKRATLLRGFGRMHETVEIAYNDDSSSSTSKYLSASQSGSSSSFASRSLSRSTGVPLPHRPRRVVRVPAVARAASNSGSTSGLMRSDEHHRPEDALRRSSVPAIFDARELQRTASRGQLLANKGARPLEVSSLSSLSLSASSLSSPLQSARTNEKSAVSSSDSTDEQPLAQRSRSAARFSATPPGAAPPQLRTSTSSPHGLRLLREAPQSQSAPHLTALIAPLNSLSAQVIAGLMPSMDSAGSSGRGSLEFADDDAADEAIDEEINSIVELLVSAHEAARGPSPQLRHRTVSRGDESALSELTIPELNLDGDLQPDFSVQRRMSAAADASVVSVGSESTPQHSSTGLSSTGISIAASAVYHAPLSFTLAETDSISGAASPQRTAVGSSTSSGASSLSESSTPSSSGSSNSNSSSSNSSSSSSSSGRGGSGGSGSDDGEVVRSRPRRVGRRRKSSASPRKGQ